MKNIFKDIELVPEIDIIRAINNIRFTFQGVDEWNKLVHESKKEEALIYLNNLKNDQSR